MTTISGNPVSPALMDAVNGSKASASKASGSVTAASGDVAAEAQERFMKLLVTQMKNQDPLNPLDNAQVTSQLAQLSTVSGINKLNNTLETMVSGFKANQTLQAASMIGHGVFVPGSSLTLKDGRALMGVELAGPADQVSVTIRDASGKAVQTMELGGQRTGMLPLVWDGSTASGAAANGEYSFEVKAMRGGDKVGTTLLGYGAVTSVSVSGAGSEGVKLNVGGGGSYSLADVRQIL